MAEILSTAAEEITKAAHLIYGGVGVAIKLNYEVMSFVMSFTGKAVQVLLLLTLKVSELLSILSAETLHFLGDVGEWMISICSAFYSFVTSISSGFQAIGTATSNGFHVIGASIQFIYLMVIKTFAILMAFCVDFVYAIRSFFVLFGSSVLFGINFVPNLLGLFGNLILQLMRNTRLKVVSLLHHLVKHLENGYSFFQSGVHFVTDIHWKIYLGALIGVFLLYFLKKLCLYAIENRLLSVDLGIPSLLTNLRCKVRSLCMRMFQQTNNAFVAHGNRNEGGNMNEEENIDNLIEEEEVSMPNNRPRNREEQQPVWNEGSSNQGLYRIELPVTTRPPLTRRRKALGLSHDVTDHDLILSNGSRSPKKGTGDKSAKELFLELAQERDNKLCVVCQDKPKTIILLPCRHMCLCILCRLAVTRSNNKCPICRRVITDTLKVYT